MQTRVYVETLILLENLNQLFPLLLILHAKEREIEFSILVFVELTAY